MSKICVVCLWWGNWGHPVGPEYINRLYRGVRRHLSAPHRFVCFTDKDNVALEHGIEVLPLDVPNWKWNLRKMIVYRPDNGLSGRVLMLDLDVVVVGNLDDIAAYDGEFATCEAAYRPRGIGGSIVGFSAGTMCGLLWNPLITQYDHMKQITRGSERKYYTYCVSSSGLKVDFWQNIYPGQVLSYKRDCKDGLPDGARIVRFHGSPRPHEVWDKWVTDNWK